MDAATAANNFWPPVGISQGLGVAIKLNAPLRIPNPLPPPLLIRVYVCTECNKVLVREPPPPPTMSRSLNASSKRVRFLGGYSEISLSRNVILKFLVFFLVSKKRVDRDSLGFTRKLSSLLEFEWNSSIQDSSFSKNRGIWIFNSTLIACIIDIIYYILDRNIDRIEIKLFHLIYSSKWKIYFKVFKYLTNFESSPPSVLSIPRV